jgi:hydroxymethylpyrimidine/phosphomethylpyrimidine kinase
MTAPPRILSIAGSDSSGGAGIQADIKTITMLGGYAMTAITAVTAQNSVGVQEVFALPVSLVEKQFSSAVNDIGIDAIKIGMLGRPELAEAVCDLMLMVPPNIPVVFDPVMVATSGGALNQTGTVAAMERLLPLASLVTPNLPELAALGGEEALAAHGCAVLVKGGHGEGDVLTDRLISDQGEIARWEAPRIDTRHTHGTGCTLSSAIATYLGFGLELAESIDRARQFVRAALEAAPDYGSGQGPMGHQAVRDF